MHLPSLQQVGAIEACHGEIPLNRARIGARHRLECKGCGATRLVALLVLIVARRRTGLRKRGRQDQQ